MRIVIESTDEFAGDKQRVWLGFTAQGTPVTVVTAGICPMIGDDDPRHSEFSDLVEDGRTRPEHMAALSRLFASPATEESERT